MYKVSSEHLELQRIGLFWGLLLLPPSRKDPLPKTPDTAGASTMYQGARAELKTGPATFMFQILFTFTLISECTFSFYK